MMNSCWKGKTLKILTFGLNRRSAGRNSLGCIIVFHCVKLHKEGGDVAHGRWLCCPRKVCP